MEILLLCIGKTDSKNLSEIIEIYSKRINHYVNFKIETIPENKIKKIQLPKDKIMEEAKLMKQRIKAGDLVVLLDENGKAFDSNAFAKNLEKKMVSGFRRLVFIVGGAYGIAEDIKVQFRESLSLSKMTFSHQMIRLFFCEQLYRAFTILKNHPYHNN